MINIIEKCSAFGNENILLCERGTTFGYNNLVVDMLGISDMKKIGNPIVFDVTHSLQIPGGQGTAASGRGEQALDLALSGVAQGIAALFIETHPSPKDAKCDGPSATKLSEMAYILKKISDLDSFIKIKMKIKKIRSIEILDSRGTPTVMTSIELEDGTLEFGYVPSGASTGSREAIEKRDGKIILMEKD